MGLTRWRRPAGEKFHVVGTIVGGVIWARVIVSVGTREVL